MTRLDIASSARDDLRDIRVYSKRAFGSVVARDYLRGLRDTFRLLRQHPYLGAEEEELSEGLRGYAFKSHRIYYRVEANGIFIVRVLHHAREVERVLRREH